MADPSSFEWRRAAAAVLAASLAVPFAGCTTVAGQQGNPGAPILVSGSVVDAAGRPVAGVATLDLSVLDYDVAPDAVGSRPLLFHEAYTTNGDGTFAIHLAPTQALAALAARHLGVLSFDLLARSTDGSLVQFSFTRDLVGLGWGGDEAVVVFTPHGAEPGAAPGAPVAVPAST